MHLKAVHMIDNAALLIFGILIVYTVIKAVKFDKLFSWFGNESVEKTEKSSSIEQEKMKDRNKLNSY